LGSVAAQLHTTARYLFHLISIALLFMPRNGLLSTPMFLSMFVMIGRYHRQLKIKLGHYRQELPGQSPVANTGWIIILGSSPKKLE
jgi:hypothetical protein